MTRISLRLDFRIAQYPSQGVEYPGMSKRPACGWQGACEVVFIRSGWLDLEGLVVIGPPTWRNQVAKGPPTWRSGGLLEEVGPPGLGWELCCTGCNPPHTLQPSTTALRASKSNAAFYNCSAGLQVQNQLLTLANNQKYPNLMSVFKTPILLIS